MTRWLLALGTPLGLGLAITGCGSWDPSIRARERAAEDFACESTTVTQTEESRWHASGCGHEGDFACTAGALEPVCIQVRTAGGEAPADEHETHDTPTIAESEAALYADAARADPDVDASADESAAEAGDGAVQGRVEAAIRAGIEAHRADVYACTQRDPTVVRATYAADGSLELRLGGGLEGSPEEGCVRAALDGAHAPAGASGTVLHLVHGI